MYSYKYFSNKKCGVCNHDQLISYIFSLKTINKKKLNSFRWENVRHDANDFLQRISAISRTISQLVRCNCLVMNKNSIFRINYVILFECHKRYTIYLAVIIQCEEFIFVGYIIPLSISHSNHASQWLIREKYTMNRKEIKITTHIAQFVASHILLLVVLRWFNQEKRKK